MPRGPRVAAELDALYRETLWKSPDDAVFADPWTGAPIARTLMSWPARLIPHCSVVETTRTHCSPVTSTCTCHGSRSCSGSTGSTGSTTRGAPSFRIAGLLQQGPFKDAAAVVGNHLYR
jgi:hypothetical protein